MRGFSTRVIYPPYVDALIRRQSTFSVLLTFVARTVGIRT